MFSIALSFIPSSLITYIVKERETKVKHQHMVSGVSLLSYWASNFTVDFVKHIVPSFFCMLMVLAFVIRKTTNQICLFLSLISLKITFFFFLIFTEHLNVYIAHFRLRWDFNFIFPLRMGYHPFQVNINNKIQSYP